MGFWEGFFHPGFLFALCLVAFLHPVAILLLDRLAAGTRDVVVTHGILEYLGAPFAYALLVLLFVLLAYPALYGLAEAPAFSDLLAASGKRPSNLINLIFLMGLLLPAMPVLGRYKGTVTAFQVMITSAVIFTWIPDVHQRHGFIRLIPSPFLLGQLLIMTVVFHRVSGFAAQRLGSRLDGWWSIHGSGSLLGPMIDFFLQGPVILRYTLFLGAQVAP